MTETLEPTDIRLSQDGGALEIEWSDGHTTTTRLYDLRWSCPCAECRGEAGSKGRLDVIKVMPADEYVLLGVQPIGRYALAPVWKSGHDTGLYTYALLRSLCQCPEHAAREAAQPGG